MSKPIVHCVPILNDNYVWLVQASDTHKVIVFDPGRLSPIRSYLQKHKLDVEAIFVTHSHNDHVGELNLFLEEYPVNVYGPHECAAIPQVTHALKDRDVLELDGYGQLSVLHLPGHLPEHLGYVLSDEQENKNIGLFSGDILFSSGCGRIFNGTAEQLHRSLMRLAGLDDDTPVYASHEYTLANIDFALSIEPLNEALQKKAKSSQSLRKQNLSTLPTTIGIEKATNPFLRCNEVSVIQSVQKFRSDNHEHAEKSQKVTAFVKDHEIFAELRKMKDVF